MSVSVADILNLPSLRKAKVLAGRAGLEKPVTTVSVLEYSLITDTQERILSRLEFYGSELVITAFSDVRDNVAAQCANIRRMAALGAPAIILYYVGIIMKTVDKRLLAAAEEEGIALICMPENQESLRYSEVITEVMEAIFRDRMSVSQYKSEILDQISRLPIYQRSMDTVIRMLSDRTRASILVTDAANQLLNSIYWPRTLELEPSSFLTNYTGEEEGQLSGGPLFIRRMPLQATGGSRLWAYVLKQDEPLREEDANQIGEILQLFINLWQEGSPENALPELVRAILQDEPYKMRRIAGIFKVDVASIHNMWIITLPEAAAQQRQAHAQTVISLAGQELRHSFGTLVTDLYDQSVVVFMDDAPGHGSILAMARAFQHTLQQALGGETLLTACFNLRDTAGCRRAWLETQNGLPAARRIWPGTRVFTWQQMSFAVELDRLLALGEEETQRRMAILASLTADSRANLVDTLAVHLLDAEGDPAKTAGLMFLHRNTVKYRLQRAEERLCGSITQMPLSAELYTALALRRVLASRPEV